MKRFLFLVLFSALYCAAAEPRYTMTETQLQKLEAICQNYKADRQKATEQLNASLQESKTLREQLKMERETTASLNLSLQKSEDNAARNEAEKVQAMLDLAEAKTQIQKQKTTIVILIGTIIALTIGTVTFVILFIKK